MNVLLIDDDDDMAFLMAVFFSRSKIVDQYFIETKGNDALNLLQQQQVYNEQPDCIFVDLKMPDMTGFEFIEKYEQLPEKHLQKPQLYILSGSASQCDQDKAAAYDCVKEFIFKPLNSSKLNAIHKHISTL